MSGTVISINLSPRRCSQVSGSKSHHQNGGHRGGLQLVPSEQARHGPRKGCEPVLPWKLSPEEEGHPIEIGSSGENLTVEGIPWDDLNVGTRLQAGPVLLELASLAPLVGR